MNDHGSDLASEGAGGRVRRVRLRFDRGTILVHGVPRAAGDRIDHLLWDGRVGLFRAPAHRYTQLTAALRGRQIRIDDTIASQCAGRDLSLRPPPLRQYQQQALQAWELAGRRGLVVLPTGAGKTHVALAAIAKVAKSALAIVPTRVLLAQWVDRISSHFDGPVAVFGDGSKEVGNLTVCTSESAYRHMDRLGDRFALLIVDEVHHFGAGVRVEALEMCCAVARLGLTATPPEDPTALARTEDLVGPIVCSVSIAQLSGTHLAPYDVIRLYVDLDEAARASYGRARETFLSAYRQFRRTDNSATWDAFVRVASCSSYGRAALRAFHESRRIVSTARAKGDLVAKLLAEHREEPALVFTADNAAAYALSRRLLVPALTCHISRKEREQVLDRLRQGALRALISSRVLNEGVDLPEVRIGIITGGALGKREHVQRVGRLLRPQPGKRAVVYELVARDTYEVDTANRRRRALVS